MKKTLVIIALFFTAICNSQSSESTTTKLTLGPCWLTDIYIGTDAEDFNKDMWNWAVKEKSYNPESKCGNRQIEVSKYGYVENGVLVVKDSLKMIQSLIMGIHNINHNSGYKRPTSMSKDRLPHPYEYPPKYRYRDQKRNAQILYVDPHPIALPSDPKIIYRGYDELGKEVLIEEQ